MRLEIGKCYKIIRYESLLYHFNGRRLAEEIIVQVEENKRGRALKVLANESYLIVPCISDIERRFSKYDIKEDLEAAKKLKLDNEVKEWLK